MRKNLVLARVGGGSLTSGWLDATKPRNWDLYLAPYQPIPNPPDLECVVGDVIPGPKWSGIREVLKGWGGWRDYEQIWLPDDDIRASQSAINEMFDVAGAVGLDLFAPALDQSSYYAHFITMQNKSFYGRWVGFVEIMIPGFSRNALELLLPTLDLTETGWGSGLDSVWPKILNYKNVGIIDGITVTHTRPVGEMRDASLRRRTLDESDALLQQYDCSQMHTTFGAFGRDLKPLELTPERLLVEVVKGSQYLFERDARVLAWIVDYQKRCFTWPEYPIAGTPSPYPGAGTLPG
jgi:hypothetical protein